MRAVVMAAALFFALPSLAQTDSPAPAANSTAGDTNARTNVLARIYQSGNGRLSRGDTVGAAGAFKVVTDTAPELPEAQLSAALTALLGDFAKRDAALRTLKQVLQSDPNNPLAQILSVFADASMSQLRGDGGLYVTSAGAALLRDAGQRLVRYPAARNGRYITAFIASGENTGDANYPVRYVDFNRMVGPGGKFKLPQWTEAVVFGQLFVLTIEEDKFAPYESRLIARLQNGLRSLESNQSDLKRVRDRIAQLRTQLASPDPAQRMIALNSLDQILNDLDGIIASNDTTVAQLKVIVDNTDTKNNAEIAENKKKILEQEQELAKLRNLGKALDVETLGKKKALTAVQQQYMDTVSKMNAAQRQLNDLQGKLAQSQSQLASAEQAKAGLEQAIKNGSADLTQIKAREDALLKQQQSSAQQAELAQIQMRKSSIANDMRTEESKLADVRSERERLQREVDDIKAQQDKKIVEHARLAAVMKQIDFGRYFALVIGNDDYLQWPKLSTAVNDANSIADVLQRKYGFNVKVIANATRKQILGAFEDYIEELGPSDNLLVYYAGHGILDDKGSGYWVPVDASAPRSVKSLRTEDLVRHDEVIAMIQRIHAKQVMVIADSCFSGGLALAALAASEPPPTQTAQLKLPTAVRTRGLKIVDQDGDIPVGQIQGIVAKPDLDMSSEEVTGLMRLAALPARVVLTSGGLEPVADQLNAKDKHSIFATSVLASISRNTGMLKSIELTNAVQDEVIRKTGSAASRGSITSGGAQTPNSTNLMGYAGEFLFVARN
jgi:hypothetical protein